MSKEKQMHAQIDDALAGNDKLEAAIDDFHKTLSEETLAYALTMFRRRMQEHGHLIVAVNPVGVEGLEMQVYTDAENKQWFMAYSSYDEQMKSGGAVMSGFTAELAKLFALTLENDAIEGLIVNPYNKAMQLDKHLIHIILGQ